MQRAVEQQVQWLLLAASATHCQVSRHRCSRHFGVTSANQPRKPRLACPCQCSLDTACRPSQFDEGRRVVVLWGTGGSASRRQLRVRREERWVRPPRHRGGDARHGWMVRIGSSGLRTTHNANGWIAMAPLSPPATLLTPHAFPSAFTRRRTAHSPVPGWFEAHTRTHTWRQTRWRWDKRTSRNERDAQR